MATLLWLFDENNIGRGIKAEQEHTLADGIHTIMTVSLFQGVVEFQNLSKMVFATAEDL